MQPMWPNVSGLNQDAKHYSIMFKNLQGSNRINEFNHLKTNLGEAVEAGYSKEDIIKILGTPSNSKTTQLKYWLEDAADKSTVTIDFINERVVGYCINKKS